MSKESNDLLFGTEVVLKNKKDLVHDFLNKLCLVPKFKGINLIHQTTEHRTPWDLLNMGRGPPVATTWLSFASSVACRSS